MDNYPLTRFFLNRAYAHWAFDIEARTTGQFPKTKVNSGKGSQRRKSSDRDGISFFRPRNIVFDYTSLLLQISF
jgi:hypothetical protein